MDNNGKLIMAILAGAAAGVVIGLLIAPEKGSETRDRLKDTAKKLADTILSKAEEAIDKASNNATKS
jgi:gas vesicle protein